ncbi:hypothetical protein AVEN_53060-1 [Araneus ventricosus]|uniref:Uncharacterized protein n=1 Tax=Araneus ventricosus TaxID=182803 RepID=A0A4Y2SLH2_ARAVE|nr:hypothetical protein AVEN_53060-1 [Araneus ventricosus]
MLHEELFKIGTGNLNLECAVLPHSKIITVIPVHAMGTTISPKPLTERISALNKKLLPDTSKALTENIFVEASLTPRIAFITASKIVRCSGFNIAISLSPSFLSPYTAFSSFKDYKGLFDSV